MISYIQSIIHPLLFLVSSLTFFLLFLYYFTVSRREEVKLVGIFFLIQTLTFVVLSLSTGALTIITREVFLGFILTLRILQILSTLSILYLAIKSIHKHV